MTTPISSTTSDRAARALRLLLVLLIAVTSVLALGPTTARAADDCATGAGTLEYPPGRGRVEIGATVVTPTSTITVQGGSWDCNTVVEIVTDDDDDSSTGERVLATVRTDQNGRFATDVTVPEDVAGGTMTIGVRGTDVSGEARTDEVEVQVRPAAEDVRAAFPPAGDEPGDQGSSVPMPVVIGLAALLAALLATGLVLAKRRNV